MVQISTTDLAGLVSPSPSGVSNVAITTNLEWSSPSAFPPTGYNVYLGTSANLNASDQVVFNSNVTTYDPPSDLDYETTYYWRVDPIESGSTVHTGSVWSFTTEPEFPPATPMKKGLYMIYEGSNTAMTILWQLETTQTCIIEWGTDTSYSTGSAQTSEYGSDHSAQVRHLRPQSRNALLLQGSGFRRIP